MEECRSTERWGGGQGMPCVVLCLLCCATCDAAGRDGSSGKFTVKFPERSQLRGDVSGRVGDSRKDDGCRATEDVLAAGWLGHASMGKMLLNNMHKQCL
jgi:hypothetical protein